MWGNTREGSGSTFTLTPTPKRQNTFLYGASYETEKLCPTAGPHVCFRTKDFEPMLLQSEYHTIKCPSSYWSVAKHRAGCVTQQVRNIFTLIVHESTVEMISLKVFYWDSIMNAAVIWVLFLKVSSQANMTTNLNIWYTWSGAIPGEKLCLSLWSLLSLRVTLLHAAFPLFLIFDSYIKSTLCPFNIP